MDKVRSFRIKEVAEESHCDCCSMAIILGDGGYLVDSDHLHTTHVCCSHFCVQKTLHLDLPKEGQNERPKI